MLRLAALRRSEVDTSDDRLEKFRVVVASVATVVALRQCEGQFAVR